MIDDVKQIEVSSEVINSLFPDGIWKGDVSSLPETYTEVADDSRAVVDRGIFITVTGYETDGHLFLANAVEKGASLLIVDKNHVEANPELIENIENTPLLLVENTRYAASILASEFYSHPSREINIHGITGTKGKTTTVHILAGILNRAGKKCAVMGTLGIEFGDEKWKSALTTPGPVEFQKRLRFLADSGATDIACEISAHAGALSRTASVFFKTITYMNLSRDHGDHFSEDEYLDAKLAIARDAVKINPGVIGIANGHDQHADKFLSPIKPDNRRKFAVYEEESDAVSDEIDFSVFIKGRTHKALELEIRAEKWTRDVNLPLIGRFNAQNAVAAVAIASEIGISPDNVVDGLNNVSPVPGRLESVDCGQDFLVVVDYAHAPQPAEEVLHALKDITKGKLIGVMGAGGSRDRGKRPMIGEVMARECDVAVITSDNPRKEEPLEIINDIMVGVGRARDSKAEVIVEVDRRNAIGLAIEKASAGDTVAILGKGHEDYQIFSDVTIHFDDREITREWLISRGFCKP